jgi:hypothetical protein
VKNHDDSSLEGEVIVHGVASAFTQTIEMRSHRIVADEPVPFGGTDAGPRPTNGFWPR